MRLDSIFVLPCAFGSPPGLIAGLTMLTGAVWAQDLKLAPEGRGLLAQPTEAPAELGGLPPAHVFGGDVSGTFSRTIFETSDDPGLTITIRDFSFPPDKQEHTIVLPSGALAHLVSGTGDVTIAEKMMDLRLVLRVSVPANAPFAVTNNGKEPIVVRMLIVEVK